jgi:manganese transport protein
LFVRFAEKCAGIAKRMKKLVELTLGILTAVGGMIDIGNLVANPQAGARFGMALAWTIPFGVVGIILYLEMGSRIATVAGRPVFDVVRERLGARIALVNLVASFGLTALTLIAEVGGVCLVIELMSGINYLLWIPPIAIFIWLVVWKMPYQHMERVYGLMGLGMLAVLVAVWRLHPDWGHLWHLASHPTVPPTEDHAKYWYFAIAQVGSVFGLYPVFFFTSGAVEEGWKAEDLVVARANIIIGFGIGMLIALSLMTGGFLILSPRGINPQHLTQSTLPTAVALGKVGLAILFVGMFAAVFGAALEASLTSGYTVAQYLGWQWGKYVKPKEASRFHLLVLGCVVIAAAAAGTTVDPVKVTEFVLVLSAAAIPLTFFPILVVANDPAYLGEKTNSPVTNTLASVYLAATVVIGLVAIPLLVWTKVGS